jgi:hypothetical protein
MYINAYKCTHNAEIHYWCQGGGLEGRADRAGLAAQQAPREMPGEARRGNFVCLRALASAVA